MQINVSQAEEDVGAGPFAVDKRFVTGTHLDAFTTKNPSYESRHSIFTAICFAKG